MARIEKDTVVDVPISTAYDQWTQFESFPEFMEGIKEVIQLDEKRLRWRAEIAGKDEEWEAEITDQSVFTRPWKLSMNLYRHVGEDAHLQQFRCVEFVEELMYGHLRKEPLK